MHFASKAISTAASVSATVLACALMLTGCSTSSHQGTLDDPNAVNEWVDTQVMVSDPNGEPGAAKTQYVDTHFRITDVSTNDEDIQAFYTDVVNHSFINATSEEDSALNSDDYEIVLLEYELEIPSAAFSDGQSASTLAAPYIDVITFADDGAVENSGNTQLSARIPIDAASDIWSMDDKLYVSPNDGIHKGQLLCAFPKNQKKVLKITGKVNANDADTLERYIVIGPQS